jgi:hypothetical protein
MRERIDAPAHPVLQYLAIMSAARDFGLSRAELERVARRFHPLDISPRALADVLADALTRRRPA